ncbi:DUF72 domain-containing protein [Niabella ginsengisoli]|uniref:DUF72 domain-containing protein n=1 Tax=Niabella ginsengisoli TaxID=522298 RepID=A0ABS9SGP9_9BACT|nr:DUF72 domain-containing protein [Niabella ginsengisoli]MCH5597525.1 DUF72 domain-containing protein [Niabella ginsengisoli]
MLKKLKSLLSQLKIVNRDKWPIALEFRNKSWYNEATYELLNAHNATMVFHDKTGSEPPQPDLDSNYIYLRFHGPAGDYKGSYDEGFLYEYAGYISEWLESGKVVYVYFNNTMGNALENLKMLKKFIKK